VRSFHPEDFLLPAIDSATRTGQEDTRAAAEELLTQIG
jgi:hypothetical protein